MANPMTTPATIASGLSAAQKRALLWLPEDGSANYAQHWNGGPRRNVMEALQARHLAVECGWEGSRNWKLQPLGLSVRRHLAAQREGGGDV